MNANSFTPRAVLVSFTAGVFAGLLIAGLVKFYEAQAREYHPGMDFPVSWLDGVLSENDLPAYRAIESSHNGMQRSLQLVALSKWTTQVGLDEDIAQALYESAANEVASKDAAENRVQQPKEGG